MASPVPPLLPNGAIPAGTGSHSSDGAAISASNRERRFPPVPAARRRKEKARQAGFAPACLS